MHRSAEEAMMEDSERCGGSSWYEDRVINMGEVIASAGWSPGSVIKKAGRGIKKGAQVTAKYGKKGAMLATAPSRLILNASVWTAFAPIRAITNHIISKYVGEFKKRKIVVTKVQGRTWLYSKMSASRNPILRGGVLLLKQYGPGTSPMVKLSGDFVGADFVGADFVGANFVGANFVGADFVGAAPAAAIPALTASLEAAVPSLTSMAVAAAVAAATAAAKKGVDSVFRGRGAEPIEIVPSDASVDNALDPQPTDGISGWEDGY